MHSLDALFHHSLQRRSLRGSSTEDLEVDLESLHGPPAASLGRTVSTLLATTPANRTTSVSHSSKGETLVFRENIRMFSSSAVASQSTTFSLRGELISFFFRLLPSEK